MVLSSFHGGGKTGSSSSLHHCKAPGWMWRNVKSSVLKCAFGLEDILFVLLDQRGVVSKEKPCDIFSLTLSCKQTSLCVSRQTLPGLISQQKPKSPLSHCAWGFTICRWKWLVGQLNLLKQKKYWHFLVLQNCETTSLQFLSAFLHIWKDIFCLLSYFS